MDVVAVGWACPLGLSSRAAYAAMRAGFRLLEEEGEGPAARRVSKLADNDQQSVGTSRAQRAQFFAQRALDELLNRAPIARDVQVCLAGSSPALARTWESLRRPPPLPATARLHDAGRAGIFAALSTAMHLLEDGSASQVLLACFDSQVAADAPGPTRARDRIAGEGAAFILLAPAQTCSDSLVRIQTPLLLQDPAPFDSGTPSRGAGLTDLFRALVAPRDTRVDVLFSANPIGDWWARELSYAYLRNAARLPEPLRLTSLYEHLGDAGAASGASALVAAIRALTPLLPRRTPEYRSAVVFASSDRGAIGGCCIEATRPNP